MEEKNLKHRKPIKYPKPSEKLAEFIGIFLGDGFFSNKYQIAVSYNYRREKEYARYIGKLVYDLFGVKPKWRFRAQYGSADVVVTSSNLVDYLRTAMGMPVGHGKSYATLPLWLFKARRYKIGLVRGLFDSEGCVYKHSYVSNGKRYSYVKLAITNYCDNILVVFSKFLRDLGIDSTMYRNRVHIYCERETRKFFKLVGTSNSKNKKRFRNFITTRRGTQVV